VSWLSTRIWKQFHSAAFTVMHYNSIRKEGRGNESTQYKVMFNWKWNEKQNPEGNCPMCPLRSEIHEHRTHTSIFKEWSHKACPSYEGVGVLHVITTESSAYPTGFVN
jgi:hypothetical protein